MKPKESSVVMLVCGPEPVAMSVPEPSLPRPEKCAFILAIIWAPLQVERAIRGALLLV